MPSFPIILALAFFAAAIGAWVIFVGLAGLTGAHIGLIPSSSSRLPKERLFDLTRSTVTTAGLLAGVFAIVYAYRKQRIDEATSLRADSETLGGRYQAAAEQLGHERAAVRLAGIYALSRLADDDSAQRETICRLLCAYLRIPYDPEAPHPGEREVRLTAIKVISEHLQDPAAAGTWCGFDLDFSGAVFDGGSFAGAHFVAGVVNFSGCNFTRGTVSFDSAKFLGADVNFGSGEDLPAVFTGAQVLFTGAHFLGGVVSFIFARFEKGEIAFGAAFFGGSSVTFGSCVLGRAELSFGGPIWLGAKFAGGSVTFSGAHLKDGILSFAGADFCGSEVRFDATLSGTSVFFDEAYFVSGSILTNETKIKGGLLSFDGCHTPEKVFNKWPLPVPPASAPRKKKAARKRKNSGSQGKKGSGVDPAMTSTTHPTSPKPSTTPSGP
ncbi:pentapeptide repeat-containing protein [Streptomyces sp. NPDC001816]|uniref:pentapeptide repeat-containing protein n=1 Tax=Streptomyces sp. NPDC001816 TaxID=3364612 RepID=UPI0036BDB658